MARWVTVRWDDSFVRDVASLANAVGLEARPTENPGVWRFTTQVQYYDRSPEPWLKIEVVHVLGDSPDPVYDVIERWAPLPAADDSEEDRLRIEATLERLLHVGDGHGPNLAEYVQYLQLRFLTEPASTFRAWFSAEVLPTLERELGGGRLVLISMNPLLHGRVAFAKAIFASEHAREWISNVESFERFGAMSQLLGGVFQGDGSALVPLLAANAPWVVGTVAPRIPSGMMAVLFGDPMLRRSADQYPDIAESVIANYLTSGSITHIPVTPDLAVEDAVDAMRWWIDSLNRLVDVCLDPTVFSMNGQFQPGQQLGQMVSIDRLVASTIALLIQGGVDEYSRRLHLFEALDLLDGMGLGGYDTTLSPSRLQRQLDDLHTRLPPAVWKLVMPRCRIAVEALKAFKESFHPGRVIGDGLQATLKNGSQGTLSLDKATYQLVRILRNAGHTLSKSLDDPADRSLLAAHEADLAPEVSDVAMLHLVRLMADPERMKRALIGRNNGE